MTREHIAQLIREKGHSAQLVGDSAIHCKAGAMDFHFVHDESHWDITVGSHRYHCPSGSDMVDIALELLSGKTIPANAPLTALSPDFCKRYGIKG